MRDPMHPAARLLLSLAYLVVVLLPFREFWPRFDTHLVVDHGDALLQHLHCSWQWLALVEGRFHEIFSLPTMAPYRSGLAFGEPLLGIVFPFAPLYWLTGSSAAAFNSAIVASFALLFAATYLWVREVTGSTPAGLLAGMLVLFPPWRLHYLSAANVLTLHYAVFGMWLVSRWLGRPGLGVLLGAALLFHVQLMTAAQTGLPAIYLTSVWLFVEWVGAGRRYDATRCVHLVAAALLFVGLSLPWWAFFQEAFDARSGQPPMRQMLRYSHGFAEMARMLGVMGPLGVCAALGIVALPVGLRRGWLPRGAGRTLVGVSLGGALLFVLARGPATGSEVDATRLPGYYASQILPLLGLFRAPVRLAGLTPLVLALVAGAGLALVDRTLGPGRWRAVLCALPLLFLFTWPELPQDMAAPIDARPDDLELARTLGELPSDASILSLPMELGLPGAETDERVLVHRRRQIGAFASVMPAAFVRAQLALGQWPISGLDLSAALGATHVVVPLAWFERHHGSALQRGHVEVAQSGGRVVLALPPAAVQSDAWRLEAPRIAAAGRWLTLALFREGHHFEARGHEMLEAQWRRGDEVSRVAAMLRNPGVLGPHAAARIHVPTPSAPGRYQLLLPLPGSPGEIEVEVKPLPTTFDMPIRDADIELESGYRAPAFVRAAGAFAIDARVRASAGPILLASSRHILPEQRGETWVLFQYRGAAGERFNLRLPDPAALSYDLAPGDEATQRWLVQTPIQAGSYDLYARFVASGVAENPMPWRPLLRDIEVAYD